MVNKHCFMNRFIEVSWWCIAAELRKKIIIKKNKQEIYTEVLCLFWQRTDCSVHSPLLALFREALPDSPFNICHMGPSLVLCFGRVKYCSVAAGNQYSLSDRWNSALQQFTMYLNLNRSLFAKMETLLSSDAYTLQNNKALLQSIEEKLYYIKKQPNKVSIKLLKNKK